MEKYEDSSVSTVVHDENVEELNETEHDNGISIANERKVRFYYNFCPLFCIRL